MFIIPVIYDLDENGEATTVHFFCSEKCRKKIEFTYDQEGESDSYLEDSRCESCGILLKNCTG